MCRHSRRQINRLVSSTLVLAATVSIVACHTGGSDYQGLSTSHKYTTEPDGVAIQLQALDTCACSCSNQDLHVGSSSRRPQRPFPRPTFWRRRQLNIIEYDASSFSLADKIRGPVEGLMKLLLLRGGATNTDLPDFLEDSDDDDEYDDDEDIDDAEEDEATAMHQKRRDLHRNKSSPNPFDADRVPRRPAPYIPRKKKKKKKNALVELAKSSINLSKKAAVTTVQTSGKAAFYLMRPKSIQEEEIWGVWRLDQQVGMKQSTANIELTPRGYVIIRAGNDIIWKAPFQFIAPTWPQSCRVEFEARAFQPSSSSTKGKPWLLFYKGYLERKVADSSVIKMVGKLYEIERPKSMFGRKELPVRYHKIGSFVGRRRVVVQDDDDDTDDEEDFSDEEMPPPRRGRRRPDDEEEDETDDEYDDDDEYDEDL